MTAQPWSSRPLSFRLRFSCIRAGVRRGYLARAGFDSALSNRQPESETGSDEPVGLVVDQAGAKSEIDLEVLCQQHSGSRLKAVAIETIPFENEGPLEFAEEADWPTGHSAQRHRVVEVHVRSCSVVVFRSQDGGAEVVG